MPHLSKPFPFRYPGLNQSLVLTPGSSFLIECVPATSFAAIRYFYNFSLLSSSSTFFTFFFDSLPSLFWSDPSYLMIGRSEACPGLEISLELETKCSIASPYTLFFFFRVLSPRHPPLVAADNINLRLSLCPSFTGHFLGFFA